MAPKSNASGTTRTNIHHQTLPCIFLRPKTLRFIFRSWNLGNFRFIDALRILCWYMLCKTHSLKSVPASAQTFAASNNPMTITSSMNFILESYKIVERSNRWTLFCAWFLSLVTSHWCKRIRCFKHLKEEKLPKKESNKRKKCACHVQWTNAKQSVLSAWCLSESVTYVHCHGGRSMHMGWLDVYPRGVSLTCCLIWVLMIFFMGGLLGII